MSRRVDRQADAVDGDRALVGQEPRQVGGARTRSSQLSPTGSKGVTVRCRRHGPRRCGRQAGRWRAAPSPGSPARSAASLPVLASDSAETSMVKLAAPGIEGGDRHAGAVERDAVTQADVVEIAGGETMVRRLPWGRAAEVVDGGDAPHAGNDSGEHRGILEGRQHAAPAGAGLACGVRTRRGRDPGEDTQVGADHRRSEFQRRTRASASAGRKLAMPGPGPSSWGPGRPGIRRPGPRAPASH